MSIEKFSGKTIATISYFTIFGTLIALTLNQNEQRTNFAAFHIRQALGVFLLFFLMSVFLPFITNLGAFAAFYVFFFVQWMYGFLGAIQGKMWLIPVLGNWYQKGLKGINN